MGGSRVMKVEPDERRRAVAAIIGAPKEPVQRVAVGFAPANIALCKYWGKRDSVLNLPVTSSLSLSLGSKGTSTQLSLRRGRDAVWLNGRLMKGDDPFVERLSSFLNLFRPASGLGFDVRTCNTIPTAAGLASSASGFAALVLALNELFAWRLDRRALSILARLGSGSACRSVCSGFVEWRAGCSRDGSDSYAQPLEVSWPDLRWGILYLNTEKKAWSSRRAMEHTQITSPFYGEWPRTVQGDLAAVKQAIVERDFERFGQTSESNALALHALAIAARPSILYWQPATLSLLHRIQALRRQGLSVYATMDAGPNVKVLFLESSIGEVQKHFPDVEIIAPFAPSVA